MALIKEYLNLTEQHKLSYGEKTIIFMQNGAFFEIYALRDENNNYYGSNILDFSRICDLNIVDRKSSGNSNIIVDNLFAVNAGFKTHLIDKQIKKMQENGYTILVYEEDENKKRLPNEKITRSLTETYSLGTYISSDTEYNLIGNNTTDLNNNICCIWIETKKLRSKKINRYDVFVGISLVDVYTGKTCISEYKEEWIKNPTTFDELERFISTYNPNETIIIYNFTTNDVNDVITYCNIKSKSMHLIDLNDVYNIINEENDDNLKNKNKIATRIKNVEKQTYQFELLNKFYKITDQTSFMQLFNENVYATQSYCYLLDFIYQHNPNLINKISEPIYNSNNNKLILANHSLKQLNIIDDDNYKGKYSSVCKMLNECITSMGKREFNNIFLNPITDENYLNNEYNIIEYLIEKENNSQKIINANNINANNININNINANVKFYYNSIKTLLNRINDISKINRQIILKKSTPKIIYQLYNSINICKEIYENFVLNDEIIMNYLNIKINNFENIYNYLNNLINYIKKQFIIEDCYLIDNIQKIDLNFINCGVDETLDRQIEELMENQDKLNALKTFFNTILQEDENKAKEVKTKTIKSTKRTKKSAKEILGENDHENYNNCNDINDSNIYDECDDNLQIEQNEKSFIRIHTTEKNNIGLVSTNKRCKTLEVLINNNAKYRNPIEIEYISRYNNQTNKKFIFEFPNQIEFTAQSSSNKYILNKQINEICSSLTQIKNQISSTIKIVFQNILTEMQIFNDNIECICDFIKYIDLIHAKMFIANKFNYCKPIISIKNDIKSFVNVTGLRHCLIEKIQQNELYVSNDLNIGSDSSINGVLLYGTNAVGKTSFIKALGISIIMAQAGLYVPASTFEYKPYKYIFTRILGNDNIFKGLSTFAVEMSELNTILKLANDNSLVLGDELCSGTESTSATSIFVSGIQYLSETNCSFIFATHLHEILNYDEIINLCDANKLSIKHMSVIYNNEMGCLEYDRKLKDGPGNNMYGLEVCKSLHLPQIFLENANNIRMKYHPESKSILENKQSHFNQKKIILMCEICNKLAKEVHHLQYQSEADEKGIINKNSCIFHKNHKANLLNICDECHDKIHKENKQYKRVKTTNGYKLKEIVE